ncbi:hypothetical protein K402DRAFT_158382 [Aulographum hederae CBS 113979]|uniref:Cell polarity protein-like protein n=1 Tax=Aulographum hederae CBS 113979 TaxID=1176131 RepID=A0A6G1GT14_9PEZI|nr:hypothetical protein K402DRAFT_158382 [Aulographum hederae CBS 113979]
MSFLFGKSKNKQNSALPAASRNITSAHGQNGGGMVGSRDGSGSDSRSGGSKTVSPTPGVGSVNASLNSLAGSTSPEPKAGIATMDPNAAPSSSAGPVTRVAGDSPYPWSQRRLTFSAGANPFPRYGAAVNSHASKEGWIYLMGGLINSTMVKGDLWMVEAASGNMTCFPVNTPSEGPGPRVGHASLLVGNAFIVFGGDTKMGDEDVLDDTLYLLNTATKQWSKALPAGPRPAGRYGHTLNILGSKIYIFGGQVEGYFFNDLVAFDLNALQVAGNKWQILIPNGRDGGNGGPMPPPRTNHSTITWMDKLYLFGGTDGTRWFNDVWTYDPRTNQWEELDCIGYIPAPREGHAAALVDDTMYIFGGRVQDGSDLGDLAAFRISSRRWYMFQNMGMSPSARSGHSMTAYGKNVIVLGGEPSSAPSEAKELSLCYVLDTSKIRYPPNEGASSGQLNGAPLRKYSGGDRTMLAQGRGNIATAQDQPPPSRGSDAIQSNIPPAGGSRLPRAAAGQAPSGPPPQQQPPQPRANGAAPVDPTRSRKNTGFSRSASGSQAQSRTVSRSESAAGSRETTPTLRGESPEDQAKTPKRVKSPPLRKESTDTTRSASASVSRSGSRNQRQQPSLDSIEQTPRQSMENNIQTTNRHVEGVDSGIGSSPALSQQNDELARELEAVRGKNAWFQSELAIAKKAGYIPNGPNVTSMDERTAEMFADDDRPLIDALLKMRAELARVQSTIESQGAVSANKIADIEKQRDSAVSEAAYAKAKLAALGIGSQSGTPQPDVGRGMDTPEPTERINEINRRLAASLAAQTELSTKSDKLVSELEAERRARNLAQDTAEAAEKRVSELDMYRQRIASEVESLRAELHEAQRVAREEAAKAAEAIAASQLLEVDHKDLTERHRQVSEDTQSHTSILVSLHEALGASSDKATLLEKQLEDERSARNNVEEQLSQLQSKHENHSRDLENTTRRLRDAEDMASKHAAEATTHRMAMLSGLSRAASRTGDEDRDSSDSRVQVLQQQVETANAMVRKNQEAADLASEKLRRAEERIAGLEAYQEQASRESLTIRKQLQSSQREIHSHVLDKTELTQQLERHKLDSNATSIQLSTLKNILDERGISSSVADRRSRALDSPGLGSRFGTPDLNRVRELEQQLDASLKAHEEMRQTFESRENETSREWEEKLAALENDQQAAVKYVRGIEKMLSKMKTELQRSKNANAELEARLSNQTSTNGDVASRDQPQAAQWDSEREALRSEIAEMQQSLKSSISSLEGQIATLKTNLSKSEQERENLQQSHEQAQYSHRQQMESVSDQSRADLEHLKLENAMLSERARDAENKVQMFLDQFESSVDNYRRQSRLPEGSGGMGHINGGNKHMSMGGESVYSEAPTETDTSETDLGSDDDRTSGDVTPSAPNFPAVGGQPAPLLQGQGQSGASASTIGGHSRDRSSTALDSLATELDALRTHWETTNKNYRLSDRFDFDRSPQSATPGGGAGGAGKDDAGLSESLASWRRRLDMEDESEEDKDDRDARVNGLGIKKKPEMEGGMI